MSDLPASARVVIIGGGIVGCSTAYHLGAMGADEVLLLERHRLSSGSTWHAAGLVGQLRTNANVTQLLGYSVALYDRLEAETGLATGWKRNGGLRLACTPERWTEVKRQATTARSFGLEMHLLTPREAQELWPLMTVDDVVGAAFLPTDGQASPSDLVQALARGARQKGVAIREGVRVTGIRVEAGRVTGVETDQGFVACDKAVCCAGQWSRALGRMAGVNVPLVSVQHQYLITERIDGVTPGLPTLRDPDRLTYYKEEVGGLVMGAYEPNPKPWAERGHPRGLRVPAARRRLGPFRADDGARARPRPRAAAGRGQAVHQRPGELHARRQLHPRRGARGRRLLRRRRLQRLRHRLGRRRRHGARRMGGDRRAALRPLAGRHPSLRAQPPLDALGADPHARGLCQALHDGLAERGIRLRPAAPALAALRPARGERRGLRREARLGAAELVRRTGRGGARRLQLRTAELVRGGRARAPGLPGGGRALRPDLVREVPDGRARRRGGAVLDLRERRRPAAGHAHLHPDAEREGRDRVRPDAGPARGGRLLHRHRHRLRHPRLPLDPAQRPAGPRRAARRRDLAARGAGADGAAGARHPRGGGRGGRLGRGLSRSAGCGGCRSPGPR